MNKPLEHSLKVMIVVPNMSTQLETITGGVHSAVMNLLRGFAALGNPEVMLVSINESLKEPVEIQFASNVRIYYLPEGPFPSSSLNYFFVSTGRLRKLIKSFQPDLVHYQIGGTLLFTRWASMFSLPHLITIHGIPWAELKIAKHWKQKLTIWLNAIIGDWLYPDTIIQISAYSREQFRNRKINRFCIIPNAIPSRYADIDLKEKMTNHLVFVGIINDLKNQLFILQVLKELRDSGYLFTIEFCGGFGNAEYQQKIESYIKDHHLNDHVRFNGWVAYSDLPKILERSDMLVLTSRQEALPMSIAEAMAAGRPVLATRVGGIPEMINDEVNGFLVTIDSTRLAVEALKKVYNNDSLMLRLGKAAKEKALSNYLAESVAERTIEFYQQILISKATVPAV
ncbi:glycosyltransferase family 4 protein [Flavihumibacter sp. RY-1]|uniref:Glycosyltransferase family 4 protein n=1 Tax=Flavihumibacter fluminis TaxID=2909236 RepID=A0ABS9BHL0_9BACT|nr:glycosyltransferase family 4 protein [Flavihumibacter fluminis]